MQRIKQFTSGALFIALSTTGLAFAGEQGKEQQAKDQQGGRSAEPAARTGSGAHRQASGGEQSTQDTQGQSASNPQPAGDMSTSPGAGAQSTQGARAGSESGAAHLTTDQIRRLQRELSTRGMYQGAVDGAWGPQTMAALRQFQQQQGLDPSGRADAQTRQALGLQLDRQPVSGAQTSASPELQPQVGRDGVQGATGTKPSGSQVPLQSMTPEQLRMLQTHLQQYGFYRGPVDGTMGENTRAALQRFFQTQAELASRGVLSETTSTIFGLPSRELDQSMATGAGQGRSGSSSQGSSMKQGAGARSSGTSGAGQPQGQPSPRGEPTRGAPQQGTSEPGMRSPQPGGTP